MELNKEGTLLINAFKKEIAHFKLRLEELENLEPCTEESELRLNIRKSAYESLLECMQMELDKFNKLRDLEIKSKNIKNNSDVKSVLKDLISLLNEE